LNDTNSNTDTDDNESKNILPDSRDSPFTTCLPAGRFTIDYSLLHS
jgi:hypothetical protein